MRSMSSVSYGVTRSRLGKMVDRALDHEVKSKNWPKKRISPSMFPICSVQEYVKQLMQKQYGGVPAKSGTMLNIFARAGSGMHEALQNAMGESGQFFGHWKCTNKECTEYPHTQGYVDDRGRYVKGKHTRVRSTNNKCPCCKKSMAYVEFKILYKNLKGFVDGIVDNLDGTYSLLDFKSTTVTKAGDGTFFVHYHQMQIATYAWILKHRYGLNIIDYTLIYVPRDNPKKFVEKTFKFDDKEGYRAKKFMDIQLDAWDAVLESARTGDPRQAIKHKPCKSQEYYWEVFHGYDACPFVDFCFIPHHLRQALESVKNRIRNDPDLNFMEIVKAPKKHQKGLTGRKQAPKAKIRQFTL